MSSNHKFCERRRWGWIQQPSNTLSGLAFLVTAFVLRRIPGCEHHVWMMVLLAIATAWMHATGGALAGRADMCAMFLIIVYSLLQNVGIDDGRALQFAWIAAVVAIPRQLGSLPVFAVVTAAWILSYLPMLSARVVCGYIVFFLSIVLWKMDVDRTWCKPFSVHQGHAWWHIGSAVGFALLLPVQGRT